uniref:Tubulin/FtsZ GTPase domain-containing protein n=1 Tax=Glossina palpalis gambiensis TaxID=67801 RepID=A0A1B0B407_9MUSC
MRVIVHMQAGQCGNQIGGPALADNDELGEDNSTKSPVNADNDDTPESKLDHWETFHFPLDFFIFQGDQDYLEDSTFSKID